MTRVRWEEPVFVAAFRKFDWNRGRHNDPILQSDPGLAHAVRQFPGGYGNVNFETKEPLFLDGVGAGERALCGANVRALLPIEFNEQDPDACPKCVKMLSGPDKRVFAPRPTVG